MHEREYSSQCSPLLQVPNEERCSIMRDIGHERTRECPAKPYICSQPKKDYERKVGKINPFQYNPMNMGWQYWETGRLRGWPRVTRADRCPGRLIHQL